MGTDGDERAEITLPASPASPASARRFVADVLWRHSFSSACIETAVLLTSEVVTNAVVHAQTEIDVLVAVRAPSVRIAVRDQGPGLPVVRKGDAGDAVGLGLTLVRGMAEDWGVVQHDDLDSKWVWFELRA